MNKTTRRQFIENGAALGTGFLISESRVVSAAESPNEKLNIGVIGRGAQNLQGYQSENIVAMCDVDELRAAKTFEQFPGVKEG